MKRRQWLLVGMVFLCKFMLAQQIPVLKYGTDDGLGHSIVYRIYQDKKGFLWFSTDNGLTRYDGQVFRNFVAKDGLRSNFVFGIAENDSAMVVSTFGGGLQLTDGLQLDTVHRIAPAIQYPINIMQDDSVLWVVDRFLNLQRVTRSGTTDLTREIKYPIQRVSQVVKTAMGVIVCSYGLHRYNSVSGRLEPISHGDLHYFQAVQELPDNRLLAVYADGLALIDLKLKTSKTILERNFSFGSKNLFRCQDGTILVATTEGELLRLSPDMSNLESLLKNVVVNDIAQDAAGKIWLATYGQGVWCLPSFNSHFMEVQGLLSPSISYSASHQTFFVTSLNRGIFSIANEKIELTRHALSDFRQPILSSTFVFEPKHSKEVIVGTSNGFIRKINQQSDFIKTVRPVSAFWKDSRGAYWIGLRSGLLQMTNDFKKKQEVIFFRDKIVRSLTEDKDDQLLVGTNDGLFQRTDSTWKRYGKQQGLSNEYINALLPDRIRNLIWVATNEGVFQLLPDQRIKQAYGDIRCNSLVLDRDHRLWGSTSKGLLYFDGDGYQLLGSEEGVDGNLFGVAYDDNKHELAVLSNMGITLLQLENYVKQLTNVPPRLIITEQLFNGKSVSIQKPLSPLPSNTTSISLRLSAPYFRSHHQWHLFYKINDEEWQNARESRELNFVELPFGNVQIQMQLRDVINQKQSDSVTLNYIIETPFYRTRTFIIVGFVLFLLISASAFILLMRLIDKRRRLKYLSEHRQAELEQKVLRHMLNPHFMNNAVNSIQVFVTRNDQRKTLSYLAKFARLMRVNLELLEKSWISLEKELQNIELYLEFEMLRFEGRLRYRVEVDPDVQVAKLKVPSLVLQPFVENAIWHGILPKPEGGEVIIKVLKTATGISIFVEDDGAGLVASLDKTNIEKPSRGLTLIRDRFEILNQRHPGHSFHLKSKNEESATNPGTVVHITIPTVY